MPRNKTDERKEDGYEDLLQAVAAAIAKLDWENAGSLLDSGGQKFPWAAALRHAKAVITWNELHAIKALFSMDDDDGYRCSNQLCCCSQLEAQLALSSSSAQGFNTHLTKALDYIQRALREV